MDLFGKLEIRINILKLNEDLKNQLEAYIEAKKNMDEYYKLEIEKANLEDMSFVDEILFYDRDVPRTFDQLLNDNPKKIISSDYWFIKSYLANTTYWTNWDPLKKQIISNVMKEAGKMVKAQIGTDLDVKVNDNITVNTKLDKLLQT